MSKKIEFTDLQIKEIIERYQAGELPSKIAETFGCSRDVIRDRLIEKEVSLRKPGVDKKCLICGAFLDGSNTTWYRQKNHVYKCNDCSRKEKAIEANERRYKNPEKAHERSEKFRKNLKKENPKRYTAQQMRGSAKKRAVALKLDYDLDYKYIESIMPVFCPVLGVEIKYGGGEKTKYSASLDRKIPRKGYVKGNVMVISQLANLMKNEASPQEMIKFSEWVLKTFKFSN